MDKLKSWIMAHKALSAGIAIALGLLLYLLLFSRSQPASQGASSNDALSAYYGAQAAAQQAGAATNQSTNELAAATNQIQAQRDIALAAIQGDLAKQTATLNAVAYQDWLGENRLAGQLANNPIAPGTNANWIQGTGTSLLWNKGMTDATSQILDPSTGAVYYGTGAWSMLPSNFHQGEKGVYWSGSGAPVAPTTVAPPAPFVPPFTVPTVH